MGTTSDRNDPDLHQTDDTGMQRKYLVLTPEERAKGFIRPYRTTYTHLTCGTTTTMSRPIAETYARDPHFYGATYCAACRAHFPVGSNGEFVWADTNPPIKVGA